MVTDSVVVIATRKGNPKAIKNWPDLVKPDVEVITPNPFTSGGARWNLMAAYGGALAEGDSEEEANAYLGELLKHTPVQDDSARVALQTFTGGNRAALVARGAVGLGELDVLALRGRLEGLDDLLVRRLRR
jgi:sulfate transport system substrate-binding protein